MYLEAFNVCCTLTSGLHEIPTMVRTFPHGLEYNHICKWISDNFQGMLTYILCLENQLKFICMHGCSPIPVERPFFLKVQDRFVHMDWRITMHANGFLIIFLEYYICKHSWKIVRNPFACMVVLQSMWKGPIHCWNFMESGSESSTYLKKRRQICHKMFFFVFSVQAGAIFPSIQVSFCFYLTLHKFNC